MMRKGKRRLLSRPCNKPAWLNAIVFAAILVLSVIPVAVEAGETISTDRQSGLLYMLRQDCGSCHGMTMKGGLGPGLLPADLKDKADDALVAIILDGVHGKPMPPWRPLLSPTEVTWMVKKLKEGLQ